jgi:hypothetical protein
VQQPARATEERHYRDCAGELGYDGYLLGRTRRVVKLRRRPRVARRLLCARRVGALPMVEASRLYPKLTGQLDAEATDRKIRRLQGLCGPGIARMEG